MKFDTSDSHDEFLLHNQFVRWYCKGYNIAPPTDYVNSPVYQELPTQSEYFASPDEEIFIDWRRGKGYTNEIEKLNRDNSDLTITILSKALTGNKMRLRVTGYYQLDDEGGAHYKLQRVRSKPKKHAIS